MWWLNYHLITIREGLDTFFVVALWSNASDQNFINHLYARTDQNGPTSAWRVKTHRSASRCEQWASFHEPSATNSGDRRPWGACSQISSAIWCVTQRPPPIKSTDFYVRMYTVHNGQKSINHLTQIIMRWERFYPPLGSYYHVIIEHATDIMAPRHLDLKGEVTTLCSK